MASYHQLVPHTGSWLPVKQRQVTGLMYPWRLQDLLADSNPMVVANAVAALAEIHEVSGKDVFQITSQSLFKLLRALNECTEWGQVHALLQPAVVHACIDFLKLYVRSCAFNNTTLDKLVLNILCYIYCLLLAPGCSMIACEIAAIVTANSPYHMLRRCSSWTVWQHTSHAMAKMQRALWKE